VSEARVHRVLFVCLGNICRSPLAEGLARLRAAELGFALEFDSAGTADYHVGHPPDPRARALARRHGYPIDALRGRQAQAADFVAFDVILAADASNLAALQRLRPPGARAVLARLLEYAGAGDCDVPDPYYGDAADFERVHALLDAAMPALLRRAARA
jgi:protein-tyrosine phosphatase